MGKAENATRKAQMNKILWGYSRGRGSFWLGDQGNFGSFKLKKKIQSRHTEIWRRALQAEETA